MLNDEMGNRAVSIDSYRERLTNFSNEFDLGLFIYIVKRSLVWITLSVLLAFSAAWIYLRYTAPTYESRASMQLSQSNNAQKVLHVSDLVEDNNLQADVELLRSKFFIAKAIARLPLQVSYFFKGQILTKEFYTETFFTVDDLEVLDEGVLDMPIFCDPAENGQVKLTYDLEGKHVNELFPVGRPFSTPHFRCTIRPVQGNPFEHPDQDGQLYFVINNPRALVGKYSSQLVVGIADQNAKTVSIICKDHNKYLARDLAQAMADAFIQYDVERKSESAENILLFIENQKDTVFEQLRESEIRLQTFKQDNRVSNMEELTPLLLERSNEYENEVLKLHIEDNLLDEIERSTNKDVSKVDVYELIPLLVGTSYEATLAGLIKTLEGLLESREMAIYEAKPTNVSVTMLDRQISTQKRLIMESIANMRKRIAGKEEDYEARIAEYEQRFTTLPEKQLAYSRIERLFNINEKYYTQLLEKDIEYRISKAGYVPENRVLESATLPQTPIAPDRGLVLLSYLLTGVIISFLIVLVRYILHEQE